MREALFAPFRTHPLQLAQRSSIAVLIVGLQ